MQIDFRERFLALFPENYQKNIPDTATLCSACNGVGWDNKIEGFVSMCKSCNGKGYIKENHCPTCGATISPHMTECNKC